MRDPLLDQMYLRLESLVSSYNESLERENAELREKLEKLEASKGTEYLTEGKNSLYIERNPEITSDIMSDIRMFVLSNEKIKCIKAVRKCFGIGLVDAKNFCDQVLFNLEK